MVFGLNEKILTPAVLILFALTSLSSIPFGNDELIFYGAESYTLQGSAFAESEKESMFDRLPATAKSSVRKPVWDLSKNSAGLSVRFSTNSRTIAVNWTLLNDFSMDHMADTGVKGVDLYVKNEAGWKYVGTGRPAGKTSVRTIVENGDGNWHEYQLYLPLYDGVTNLSIGIQKEAEIRAIEKNRKLPVVFYGTSITQGGCASRPGMAHTNQLSRMLDREVVNLGFSGNGKLEAEVAHFISQNEAAIYVIECLPNVNAEELQDRLYLVLSEIRKRHENAPVVFVEGPIYAQARMNKTLRTELERENKVLRRLIAGFEETGEKNIYLVTLENWDPEGEGTVDGVHFTDLGFTSYSKVLFPRLEAILKKEK